MKDKSNKVGLPPGTLLHVGSNNPSDITINVIDYSTDQFEETSFKKIEDTFSFRDKKSVSWININGLNDIELIRKIGEHFSIHPLVLEDILNTTQRPKFEEYDNFIFITMKMIRYDEKYQKTMLEQVCFILTDNCVISFQEVEGDVFNSIRERLRNNKGRIRKMNADYLAYTLIDTIVDYYFLILEKIGEKIEFLEDEVITNANPETLQIIHKLKREMIIIRKSIWPIREVVNNLLKNESHFIKESTKPYLKDIYDHTIQLIDTIETYRDMISGLLDVYMSSVSNKMNEVMKVLTIFASIFIPLTFIAGIYGMNFEYMPELAHSWAYPMIWVIFILVGFSLLLYFKMKKWI